MNSDLFRKESIDRVSSPERLNDRIRVTSCGVWLILGGIILILAGILVWSFFGRLNTVLSVGAITEGGKTVCFVKEADLDKIGVGMTVTADNGNTTVEAIALQPIQVDDAFPEYLRHLGGLSKGEWVYAVTLKDPLGDGGSIFRADIVTESIAPIKFVVN